MLLRHNQSDSHSNIALDLPGSKSLSHRYLILNTIATTQAKIIGLSESRDTQLLLQSLTKPDLQDHWFEDGATPFRFFLAYASVLGKKCTLDGTSGLRRRSIAPLVQALESTGAKFRYLQEEGFPPIEILQATHKTSHLHIQRSVSSQFASAILLVSPIFSEKFHLEMSGNASSESYIQMTLKCMEDYGIHSKWNPESNEISVDSSNFSAPKEIFIEADWSAASYFYSLCSCIPGSSFFLHGLRDSGKQGDEKLQILFENFGVISTQNEQGMLIENKGEINTHPEFDLLHNLDLAPAIICSCAFLKIPATFTGLGNLALKESDRIKSLNENLRHFGCEISEGENNWQLKFSNHIVPEGVIYIRTFADHRIAMAMSIFALRHNLEIDDANCVVKSFPGFWNELIKCNFVIK